MTVATQRSNCHIVHETASEVTVASTNTNSNEVSHPASETLSSFLAETSLHGVRFMFTGNIFRRSFWALALLTCFGICSLQVYNSVSIFYLRPFNTKITRKMVRSNIEKVSFPAVTICNFNYINKRWLKYLLKSRENLTKEEIELKLAVYERIIAGSIRDTFTEKTMERHPELFLRFHGSKKDLRQNYSQMLFGYRLEDVLLPSPVFDSCVFDGETCGSKNFTAFLTSMYRQCYTFNSGYEDHPIILATAPGHLNGLRLLLNVERNNYLYNPSNSLVGFRVLVHDQHTFPVLAQFGFAVRPGVRTFCAIKTKKGVEMNKATWSPQVINLPMPYSTNCTNRELYMLRNTGYTYSKSACMLQCISEFVIKKCGCHPVEYEDAKVPFCAMNDTMLCMFPAFSHFDLSDEKAKCEESCPQPCHHTDYEISLSYAGLPRNVFIEKLDSFLNKTAENDPFSIYEDFINMSYSEQKEYVDENIVSLDIYFQDLSYDVIEQTPTFETWNLFATLGGYFGLLLGMSTLTVLEFADFAFRRLFSKISRLAGHTNTVQ